MRRGRPCACGCVECVGYTCTNPYTSDGCLTRVLQHFYDDFEEPYSNPGWENGDRFIATGGYGVPVESGFVSDTVPGSSLPSPVDCLSYIGACTWCYDLACDGSGVGGSIEIENGPKITVCHDSVVFYPPDGSGVEIATNFQSCDNIVMYFRHYAIPPVGNYNQSIQIIHRRNGTISGCNNYNGLAVTPADTGDCDFTSCSIYSNDFVESTGQYTISSSLDTVIGANATRDWKIDQVCITQNEVKKNPGWYDCYDNGDCGRYIKPNYFNWSDTFCNYAEESGNYINLIWGFDIDELFYEDCDWEPPVGSSAQGLFVTPLSQITIDWHDTGILNVVPIMAVQDVNTIVCDTGNTYGRMVAFSGDGCGCYGDLPILSFNDPTKMGIYGSTSAQAEQGNMTIMGTTNPFPNLGRSVSWPTDTITTNCDLPNHSSDANLSNVSLLTIPREDNRYSVNRYYELEGFYSNDEFLFDYTLDPQWICSYNCYKLSFNTSYNWWEGTYWAIEGSGTSSHPLPSGGRITGGGVNAYSDFDGIDFDSIYESDQCCSSYDMYIYSPCGGGTTFYTELHEVSGDLAASTLTMNVGASIFNSFMSAGNFQAVYDTDTSINSWCAGFDFQQSTCCLFDWESDIANSTDYNIVSYPINTGCFHPVYQGLGQADLKAIWGPPAGNGLPFCMLDPFGFPVYNSVDEPQSNRTIDQANSRQSPKFGKVFNRTGASGICLVSTDEIKIYDATLGFGTFAVPVDQWDVANGTADCSYNNVSILNGEVRAEYYFYAGSGISEYGNYSGTITDLPDIGHNSFAPSGYPFLTSDWTYSHTVPTAPAHCWVWYDSVDSEIKAALKGPQSACATLDGLFEIMSRYFTSGFQGELLTDWMQSETDLKDGRYLAEVNVLSASGEPLKLEILQPFKSHIKFPIENGANNGEEPDCPSVSGLEEIYFRHIPRLCRVVLTETSENRLCSF